MFIRTKHDALERFEKCLNGAVMTDTDKMGFGRFLLDYYSEPIEEVEDLLMDYDCDAIDEAYRMLTLSEAFYRRSQTGNEETRRGRRLELLDLIESMLKSEEEVRAIREQEERELIEALKAKKKKLASARKRYRYRVDEEYRDRIRASGREYYRKVCNTPEFKEKQKNKDKARYLRIKDLPEYKEYRKKICHNYYERHRDDEELKQKNRENARKRYREGTDWYHRNKGTPEFKQKVNKWARDARQRMKEQNPEKYEALLQKQRDKRAKAKAEREADPAKKAAYAEQNRIYRENQRKRKEASNKDVD